MLRLWICQLGFGNPKPGVSEIGRAEQATGASSQGERCALLLQGAAGPLPSDVLCRVLIRFGSDVGRGGVLSLRSLHDAPDKGRLYLQGLARWGLAEQFENRLGLFFVRILSQGLLHAEPSPSQLTPYEANPGPCICNLNCQRYTFHLKAQSSQTHTKSRTLSRKFDLCIVFPIEVQQNLKPFRNHLSTTPNPQTYEPLTPNCKLVSAFGAGPWTQSIEYPLSNCGSALNPKPCGAGFPVVDLGEPQ